MRTQTSFLIQQKDEGFEDLLLTLREFWVLLEEREYQHCPPTISQEIKELKG